MGYLLGQSYFDKFTTKSKHNIDESETIFGIVDHREDRTYVKGYGKYYIKTITTAYKENVDITEENIEAWMDSALNPKEHPRISKANKPASKGQLSDDPYLRGYVFLFKSLFNLEKVVTVMITPSDEHDKILGFMYFILDKIKSSYSPLWTKYKGFFGGILLPVLFDYEILFDNLLKQSDVVKDRVFKLPPVVTGGKWKEFIEDAQSCKLSDNDVLKVPIYLIQNLFCLSPLELINEFYKWLSKSNFIDDNYLDNFFKCGAFRKYIFGGESYIGHYKIIADSLLFVAGAYITFLYDNDIIIMPGKRNGKFVKFHSKYPYTIEKSENAVKQLVKSFVDGLSDKHPLRKGGIVGKEKPVLKHPKTGEPITQDEINDLIDLLKKLNSELEECRKELKKYKKIGTDKGRNKKTAEALEAYVLELEKKKKDAGEAAAGIKALEDEIERLTKENDELKAKIKQLEAKIKQLEKEKLELQKKLKKCQDELAELRALYNPNLIKQLKDKIDDLTKEIDRLKGVIATLKEKNRKQGIEIKKWKDLALKREKELNAILESVTELLKKAKGLEARNTAITGLEATIKTLSETYAEILKSIGENDEEARVAIKNAKEKVLAIQPSMLKTQLDDIIAVAIMHAQESENFYYKLVNDINSQLVEVMGMHSSGNNNLLGQSDATTEDVFTKIREIIASIVKLIETYGIVDVKTGEKDRVEIIAEKARNILSAFNQKTKELKDSRQSLINEINALTQMVEDKVSSISANLPNRDQFVSAIMNKVKQLQLFYLKQAMSAIKEIHRKHFKQVPFRGGYFG